MRRVSRGNREEPLEVLSTCGSLGNEPVPYLQLKPPQDSGGAGLRGPCSLPGCGTGGDPVETWKPGLRYSHKG